MMKKAFKAVLSSIGLSKNKQPIDIVHNDSEAPASETNHFRKAGKGRGRKAHKSSGIAKAKRAAKKC